VVNVETAIVTAIRFLVAVMCIYLLEFAFCSCFSNTNSLIILCLSLSRKTQATQCNLLNFSCQFGQSTGFQDTSTFWCWACITSVIVSSYCWW